jgi:choline kinase
MVPVHGRPLIEWQLDVLEACGVDRISVVVGFAADQVDACLARRNGSATVDTCYNPFFEVADNLVSCWMARDQMDDDFVILNGDTLFEASVFQRLLDSPRRPITLARDEKPHYDDDDMKVQLSGDRLLKVGKTLTESESDGESIGLMAFRDTGPALFREALERSMRGPEGLRQWYLSVIGQVARSGHVWTQSIHGLGWAEVDYPLDLVRASKLVASWEPAMAGAETVGPARLA